MSAHRKMVALWVSDLSEPLAQRVLLTQARSTPIAQFMTLGILTFVFQDQSRLRRVTGQAPFFEDEPSVHGFLAG